MGSAQGVWLDVGCAGNPQKGDFVGMDLRKGPGVNVVGDARRLPFRQGAFEVIVMSHVFEHFEPRDTLGVMDEMHRACAPAGELWVLTPFGVSERYLQDPTHRNPCVPGTWSYFDPRSPLYNVYTPKPWDVVQMGRNHVGDLEVAMVKPSA